MQMSDEAIPRPRGAIVLNTARLVLRQLVPADAAFLYQLYNEPSFLANIGDRGLHTQDDARRFIVAGPMASYEQHGFGHYLVELKDSGTAIGTCGLIYREYLKETDIGFAYLPSYWGRGYAYEAAAAVMQLGRTRFGLQRIVAVVAPDNVRSIAVLEKLGLRYAGLTQLAPDGDIIHLYA